MVYTVRQKPMELAQRYIECENSIWWAQKCKLLRIIITLAYILYHLSYSCNFRIWVRVWRKLSADDSMLLLNTRDWVHLNIWLSD